MNFEKETQYGTKEIIGDMFTSRLKAYAHCISADCVLEAGIAKTLEDKLCIKHELHTRYNAFSYNHQHHTGDVDFITRFEEEPGFCARTTPYDHIVYSLVTKPTYWSKPTIETIQNALASMKDLVAEDNVKAIAMPHIACGHDKMAWRDVKPVIKEIFADTNIIIEVYNGSSHR